MRRRALLSDQFINGYVRDGLTFYIEGIDKSFDDGVLTSLVGDKSKQFTLNKGVLGDSDNSYLLSGNAFVGQEGVILHNDTTTVEMCFRVTSSTPKPVLYKDGRNLNVRGVIWYANASYILFQSNSTPKVTVAWNLIGGPKKYGTLTHAKPGWYPQLYIDGVLATNNGAGYHLGTTGTFVQIGGFTGDLFSFRVYNRVLTAEEVKVNADNDYKRFLSNLI